MHRPGTLGRDARTYAQTTTARHGNEYTAPTPLPPAYLGLKKKEGCHLCYVRVPLGEPYTFKLEPCIQPQPRSPGNVLESKM